MTLFRIFDQFVIPTLVIFLLIGSAAAAVLGAALVLRSASALAFIRAMNRWVSSRKATRELEVPRRLLGSSPWLGAFLVAGGAFATYSLVAGLEIPRSAQAVTSPKFFVSLALETTRWLVALGSVTAVVLGLLILFSPRAMSSIEARLNLWLSTRHMTPGGDSMHMPLDLLVESHARLAGWLILGFSLLVAAAISFLAAARLGG